MKQIPEERVMNHLQRGDVLEYDTDLGGHGVTRYQEYECQHCDRTFTHQKGKVRRNMVSLARQHLKDNHPQEISRDEYPHEETFLEWADSVASWVDKCVEPGDPVVAHLSEWESVELHSDGAIILKQFRVVGVPGADVKIHGPRLVIENESHANHHVSDRAFPIDR